jgi:hypothetical protein
MPNLPSRFPLHSAPGGDQWRCTYVRERWNEIQGVYRRGEASKRMGASQWKYSCRFPSCSMYGRTTRRQVFASVYPRVGFLIVLIERVW